MKTMLRVFFLTLLCAPRFMQAQCPVVNFGPDTVICVGTSITLDAGNPGATYLWNDGTTTQQLETFFEGEYAVEVTLNGCTVSDTIYVAQGPVIQAGFSYFQTGSCSPFITEFTEFSQACSAGIIEWAWNFGDGSTSTERNPVHTYALPGDYDVSLTVRSSKGASYTAQETISILGAVTPVVNLGSDINLCFGNELILNAANPGATYSWSTGETSQTISVFDGGAFDVTVTKDGCSTSDTINVVSVPSLWSDFTFEKISGCIPVKYKFTDNSTACESTITGWFWEFGDGATSTEQNPEHEFATEAQFNVRLTVTDNNGNSIRRGKRITVTASTLSINLGNDTTICFGSPLGLDAGVAGATYTWSTGETSQQITVLDDGDYSVTVVSSGCIAKDTIRVNTSASVANKWSYAKGAACLPVQVTFTDSSEAFCGQGIQSWHWEFGDGATSDEQNPVHYFSTVDSFLVRLTVTTTSGASTTTTKKIGTSNTPHEVNIPADLKVCTGETLLVDAGVDNAEYTWSPAFGVTDVHAKVASIKPMINSWYYVEVKKCLVSVVDSVYIVVDSIDKPMVGQTGNSLFAENAHGYEWYRDGVKIDHEVGKTLRVDRQGYYSVKVFNKSGCARMSDPKFFMPFSGKEKIAEMIRIKCSPNPARGRVQVLLSEIPDQPAKLVVYDRFGRAMLTKLINGHVTPVDLTRASKGLYYVEVNINGKRRAIPLVLQ
ncbi:MAG: PKD domain-containing protein [Chitinophagaceae bacterium]|nr:PKD domain-containing protein [Chitinophagaceae bacterium]